MSTSFSASEVVDNHWNVQETWVLLDLSLDIRAALLRQVQIQQDEVRTGRVDIFAPVVQEIQDLFFAGPIDPAEAVASYVTKAAKQST